MRRVGGVFPQNENRDAEIVQEAHNVIRPDQEPRVSNSAAFLLGRSTDTVNQSSLESALSSASSRVSLTASVNCLSPIEKLIPNQSVSVLAYPRAYCARGRIPTG